jgi:GNAT superfamily N-acetyltransferase
MNFWGVDLLSVRTIMDDLQIQSSAMPLNFIPTVAADLDFFIHVHHTAYRSAIESMFGWDERQQDDYAKAAFALGGLTIVWRERERVGVVGWEEHQDYLWLKEVFILPIYQNQGIGSQIVTISIARARQNGRVLRLQTLTANLGAKRLYERHGLRVTGATEIHWHMEIDPPPANTLG